MQARKRRLDSTVCDRLLDGRCCRAVDRIAAHDRRRRMLAAADARRADHAHAGPKLRRQFRAERVATGHLAGQRLAHPHRERRRSGLAFLHDVEVMVERRHLVHLGHREPHFLCQRDDVRSRDAAVGVLDPVQMLDQEVAPPWRVAEQRAYLGECLRIDGAALRAGRARPRLRESPDTSIVARPSFISRGNRSAFRRGPRGRANAAAPGAPQARCRGARAPR